MNSYSSLAGFVQNRGFNQDQPAIIENYLKEMPCYIKWEDCYLSKVFKKIKLRCECYARTNDIKYAQTKDVSFNRFKMSMKTDRMYLAQFDILKACPQLGGDVLIPVYIKNIPQVCLYYGPKGVGTKLHFDYGDNIYCNIRGVKKFVLIDPKQDIIRHDHEPDWVNFASGSQDSVIKKTHYVELVEGQSLFIPKGWWHETNNVTKSLGISIMY